MKTKEFPDIFYDEEFIESLNGKEKRTKFYWQNSTAFNQKKKFPNTIQRLMESTCHIMCTTPPNEIPKPLYQRIKELENTIVLHGPRKPKNMIKVPDNFKDNTICLASYKQAKNAEAGDQ